MFSNNVANGLATEYYEDGSVKSECTYKNGEVKGKVKEYKKGEKKIENWKLKVESWKFHYFNL